MFLMQLVQIFFTKDDIYSCKVNCISLFGLYEVIKVLEVMGLLVIIGTGWCRRYYWRGHLLGWDAAPLFLLSRKKITLPLLP